MRFQDEFEHEMPTGEIYSIGVEGYSDDLDSMVVTITDAFGESIDSTHEHYEAIMEVARNQDYEYEVHSTDFSHYNHDINNFLREEDL